MSPYEGDGDIEQERTEEVDGIKPSGDGADVRQGGSRGVDLSSRHVRRLLAAYRNEGEAGIKSPRKRRPPKHCSRRERYPKEGMLV